MTVIRFLQNVKKILHCIDKNQIPGVFCNTNDSTGPTPLNFSVKNRLSHSLCTWKKQAAETTSRATIRNSSYRNIFQTTYYSISAAAV